MIFIVLLKKSLSLKILETSRLKQQWTDDQLKLFIIGVINVFI